jgi:hypothetical protein
MEKLEHRQLQREAGALFNHMEGLEHWLTTWGGWCTCQQHGENEDFFSTRMEISQAERLDQTLTCPDC